MERSELLKLIKKNMRVKGQCEHCEERVEDTQYSLCTRHYNLWKETNDYQYMVSIDSSKTYRDLLGIGNVYKNAIKCNKCQEVIQSGNRHDFKFCTCKSCAVDGGSWYGRRVGNQEDYTEMSILFTNT